MSRLYLTEEAMPEDIPGDKYDEAKRAITERTLKRNQEAFDKVVSDLRASLDSAALPYFLVGMLSFCENLRFQGDKELFDKAQPISDFWKNGPIWLSVITQEVLPTENSYLAELMKYCEENNRPAREVVNSPEHDVIVIEAAWGSLEEYQKQELDLIETAKKYLNKLKAMDMPLSTVIQLLIKAKLKKTPDELGITGDTISKLQGKFKELTSEIVKFGMAYLEEKTRRLEERVIIYEAYKY